VQVAKDESEIDPKTSGIRSTTSHERFDSRISTPVLKELVAQDRRLDRYRNAIQMCSRSMQR
jgi:hypothetical protein